MSPRVYSLIAILLITLGVAVLLLNVAAVSGWEALDPEQVLFGFSRCGEDFTPNDDNRETRIRNWAVWKLEPRDNWTMCYVRCCLERLELFDPTTNRFLPDRVSVQYDAYKKYNGLDDVAVEDFKNALEALPQLAGCETVYTALLTNLGGYLSTIVKLYHGSPNITKLIYQDKGKNIRQKKQSYSEFCENKFYSRGSKGLCDYRKHGTSKEIDVKKVIDCVFKGFRYLDENGKIHPEEIVRDFHEINQACLDAQVRQVLTDCKVAPKTKAYDYYECLRKNEALKDNFQSAFQYREVRSADYDYAFKIPGPPVYDAAAIKKEVDRITKKQCSQAQQN